MSTFDRYTADAKRAIYFAHFEAVHRHQERISVSDLLVGLTRDSSSRAGRLVPLKETAVPLRCALEIPHLPSSAVPYTKQVHIPLEEDAKKLLAYAVEEADCDREWWIDTDHLLRAFLRFENPTRPLIHLFGTELSELRTASREDRLKHPSDPTPRLTYIKHLAQGYWTIAALIVLVLVIVLVVEWRH